MDSMQAEQRRAAIRGILSEANEAVSAGALADRFRVSRQIIVGDVAILRAGGANITATPRGYIIPSSQDGHVYRIACRHRGEDTESELNAVVDQGCIVLDVIVEHPVYGQLTGPLRLKSRYDVEQFLRRCSASDAHLLSDLTDGIHLHTLSCPSEEAYQRVRQTLRVLGFLLES